MQLSQTIKNLLIFVLILVIVFFTGRCTASKSTQDKGGVLTSKSETKTDTVYLPSLVKHDTILAKPTLKIVYKDRPVPQFQPNGELTLKHRVYEDTVEVVKNLKVGYTAKVSGVLDTIKLGIKDTRPIMVIHDSTTITNTLTKTKYPTGLYAGFQATLINKNQLSNYGPTLDLVRPKFSLGVGYDLKQASPQLRVSLNLFKTK